MAASPESAVYPPAVAEEFARLAEECRLCYQCGQCTSSCPSGRELYRGPRRLVRLILAGEIEAVMKSDDLWRCTECGSCTDNCRMDIDIASILHRIRQLERRYGDIRCPERSAAVLASKRLRAKPKIDNMQFGLAMMSRGHVPKDKVGTAEMGIKIAKQLLPAGMRKAATYGTAAPATAATVTLPFYAGCAIPQDHELHALVHEVAAGFGVRLDEADAGCCGHPSRGAEPSHFRPDQQVHTACPACDASLIEAGVDAVPLWDTLTELSRRQGVTMTAAAASFVPYVGCLAKRDEALAALRAAAEQSGATVELAYPSLHNGCCGALGGMYRGATKASGMLLTFAAERRAPVVTLCVLCRDNLRSAARELKLDVPVHFWPEFFRAAAPEGQNDD